MSTDDITPTPSVDNVERLPSLDALQAAHKELLQAHRQEGDTPEMLDRIEAFIYQGQATGAVLDAEDDRWTAQGMLDYWSATLFRAARRAPDATLADFDPNLAPELPDELCPYVGLDPFREATQAAFFGRERLVATLVEKLADSRLLVVSGPSGSGKSSVVLAGLLPALQRGALPGSEFLALRTAHGARLQSLGQPRASHRGSRWWKSRRPGGVGAAAGEAAAREPESLARTGQCHRRGSGGGRGGPIRGGIHPLQ